MINVIIPVWKGKETLPNLLNSLVAQTKKLFWVTIVQDCDGEDYSDILTEYKRRGLHITWLSTPENGGPGVARQVGIDHSDRFDYIMFADADDILMPRAVEVLYRAAKQNNSDIVISDFLLEQQAKPTRPIIATENPVQWLHGKAYKLEYLKRIGLRFLPLRSDEDAYFNLVAFNSTKSKHYVKEFTMLWRDNPDSITRKEPPVDFFKKEYPSYIHSQVEGILQIIKNTGEINPPLLAITLNYIYKFCMRARHFKFPLDEVLKDVQRFKENEVVQKAFGTVKFWHCLDSKLNATEIYESEMYFYAERFIDWFNENVKESTNEVVHS